MSGTPPAGMDRTSFIGRVSAVLGRRVISAPAAPAPAVDGSVARVVSADADLLSVFERSAAATGMTVHKVSAAHVSDRLLEVLAAVGVRRVAIADGPLLDEPRTRLAASGFELVAWHDTPGFEALYSADVGITDVQSAIAETGSLVCTSGPGSARGLSLVPPIHVAIVRRSQIVPDLIDYWTPSPNAPICPSSSVVLITGPSKTADIEGVLITGVHGPREVHILLVEDA